MGDLVLSGHNPTGWPRQGLHEDPIIALDVGPSYRHSLGKEDPTGYRDLGEDQAAGHYHARCSHCPKQSRDSSSSLWASRASARQRAGGCTVGTSEVPPPTNLSLPVPAWCLRLFISQQEWVSHPSPAPSPPHASEAAKSNQALRPRQAGMAASS